MDSKVSKGLVVGFFFLILIPSPSCFAHEVTNDRERDEGGIIRIPVLQGLGRGRERGGGGKQANFRVVRYTRIDSIGKNIFSIGKLEVYWQLLEVEIIKYTGCQ